MKWARAEVGRAVSTFRWAAEEARRVLRRAAAPRHRPGRRPAGWRSCAAVPRGPVLGISPFNFPLNLVAHKVAPAIAVGRPDRAQAGPGDPAVGAAARRALAETDLPAGMFSVLPVPNDRAAALVADPRLPVVSLHRLGPGRLADPRRRAAQARHPRTRRQRGRRGLRRLADVDLDWAASRIATFANYQAGQSCIAVQRVIVARAAYYDRMVDARDGRCRGPADRRPGRRGDRGRAADQRRGREPGRSSGSTRRSRPAAGPAPAAAATARRRADRARPTFRPTPRSAPRRCSGRCWSSPAVAVDEDGLRRGQRLGVRAAGRRLHATTCRRRSPRHRALEVGGVIVGDVPSYRADQMPYGGVKGTGIGREGLRSRRWTTTPSRG